WSTSLPIDGTAALMFRWKTNEAGASKGRWTITDSGGKAIATGNLSTAAPAGLYATFDINFATIPMGAECWVRVQALSAANAELGDPSLPVHLTRRGKQADVAFTDRGLNVAITPMLESVR